MKIKCNTIEETEKLAHVLSDCVKDDGAFITLRGNIGVGKTAFTRFLLRKIGVEETITSPTFVILNEYHSGNHIPVYHFDLYRLENTGVKTILCELEEYSSGRNLTLVEWADFAENELPKERLDVNIDYVKDKINSRLFTIAAYGEKAEKILKSLELKYGVENACTCI